MAKCKDCSGSGQYVGFTAVEKCRTCGGSGEEPAAPGTVRLDGVYPLYAEDFDCADVQTLVGTGCGDLVQVHRPERSRYALHWICKKTGTIYSRFCGQHDLQHIDFSQPTHMTIEEADGPVLMTLLDGQGKVKSRAWVDLLSY